MAVVGELRFGKRATRPFDKYAAVFVHNYRAMAAQLSRLDPSFIRCISYAALPRLPAGPHRSGSAKLANFAWRRGILPTSLIALV